MSMSITSLLKEPFDPAVIHWRAGATNAKKLGVPVYQATKGIALAYIDARDVMKRLDDVCGDNWQVEYPFDGCCRIGIKIDGEWIWRSNGAGETEVEGEKGRFSDAFKRAAVLWGVGRYLYYLPNVWCDLDNGKIKNPPALPAWALPQTKEIDPAFNVDQKKYFDTLIDKGDALALYCLKETLVDGDGSSSGASIWLDLCGSFPKGEKGKKAELIRTLVDAGKAKFDDVLQAINDHLASDDSAGIEEVMSELSELEKKVVMKKLPAEATELLAA